MAYDIQRLEEGLVKADAAGDSIAAKAFADEIRRMRSGQNEEASSEPPVEAIEPSLSDKALSYGASALSGVTALPRGAAQLGWNIGEEINKLAFPTTYGEGMELTPYAEERLLASGGKLPEYKDPEFLPEPLTIKGQQAVVDALKEKAGREGFDWTELAGMIASPASLMKTGISKTPTFMGKVGEGAKVGGLYGIGMPVTGEGDFFKKKVEQALLSSATGGALPILGKAISKPAEYAREFVKPFTQKGIVSDVEKFAREKFGSGRDKIVAALRGAKEGETSAQAIARANLEARRAGKPSSFGSQIAATEKDLAMKAEGGDPLKSIYQQQAAAREREIGKIAGTEAEMTEAQLARARAADDLYNVAFNQAAKVDPELAVIAKNPYFKKSLSTASNLSQAKGITPKDNIIEFLHMVKVGVDKQLSKTGDDALAGMEKQAAMDLKNQLIGWMGKKTGGAYTAAREKYSEMSKPINRMEIGQQLKEALTTPLEKEGAAAFAKAMRDAPQTIKKATKFKGSQKLSDFLEPEEIKAAEKVKQELLSETKRAQMASEGESMLPKLSGEIEFSLPHILSRPIVVANTVLKAIATDKTPEYRAVLSEIMKDPKRLEQILMRPENSRTKEIAMDILNQISKAAPMGAAQAAGGQ